MDYNDEDDHKDSYCSVSHGLFCSGVSSRHSRGTAVCLCFAQAASPVSRSCPPCENHSLHKCTDRVLSQDQYSLNLQTPYFSKENFSLHTSLTCTWETPQEGFTYGAGQSLERLLGISISSLAAANLQKLLGCPFEVNWPETPCKQLLCAFCSHFLLVLEVLRHTSVPVTLDH